MLCPGIVETSVKSIWGAIGEHVLCKHAREQAVHPADRVADRHRAERVAVVAAAHGQQPPALGVALRPLELQAQLDRDLDRDRAGVGKEHLLQPVGSDLHEALRQEHRRLVGEPAEHHMRHPPELLSGGGVERGMAIAVNRTPPRGHTVDQLTPIRQLQAHPLSRTHWQRRLHAGQRAVGMPDVLAVEREQCVPVGSGSSPRRGRSRACGLRRPGRTRCPGCPRRRFPWGCPRPGRPPRGHRCSRRTRRSSAAGLVVVIGAKITGRSATAVGSAQMSTHDDRRPAGGEEYNPGEGHARHARRRP